MPAQLKIHSPILFHPHQSIEPKAYYLLDVIISYFVLGHSLLISH